MYANLKVTIDRGEPIFAWDLDITETEVIIHLDANDGQGNYAESAGTRGVPRQGHEINVMASY